MYALFNNNFIQRRQDPFLRNDEEVQKFAKKVMAEKEVDVAYARIMLLGPAGVGKSSFVRGLKNQPHEPSDSTILANVHLMRPVSYGWTTGKDEWQDVEEQDEVEEVANLLAAVYPDELNSTNELVSSVKSVMTLYEESSLMSSEVQTEHVKALETTKVDSYLTKAIELAKKLRALKSHSLQVQPFLHIWDCGGQPVFLEVLPAFLTSRTMFLLLFDASKKLESLWKSVQLQQGEAVQVEEVNMTIIELLHKWMATIHSNLSRRTEKGGLVEYPRIMCIGTHGDALKEDKQNVIDRFYNLCKGKAYLELLEDVFVVDNTTSGKGKDGEDPVFAKVRKEIQRFAMEKLIVKTPVGWILFRKVIQMFAKDSKNVIGFSEVKAIAVACKIKPQDVHNVLAFYHELGVILHYPHVTSLKERVILDPKWFVECLGKILTLSGREPRGVRELWLLLRERGILVRPLYVAAWKDCEGIEPEAMMELLVHFRLAARVETEEYFDLNAPQYFVPSVLPIFDGELASPTGGVKRATPLHITFSTKFVPPGYFTRFVTTMSSFKACRLYFKDGIYRNRVVFEFGDGPKCDHVTFSELPHAIQVDIIRNASDSVFITPFNKVCRDLLTLLKVSCSEVDEHLMNKHYVLTLLANEQSTKISRNFKLLCQCDMSNGPHYIKDFEEMHTCYDHCCCERKKEFRELKKEESHWVSVAQQGMKKDRISQPEMYQISKSIGEKGFDLAAQLGLITQFKSLSQEGSNRIIELLYNWDQQGGTRADIVAALKSLKLVPLATEIEGMQTFELGMDLSPSLFQKRTPQAIPPAIPDERNNESRVPHLNQPSSEVNHPVLPVPFSNGRRTELHVPDLLTDNSSINTVLQAVPTIQENTIRIDHIIRSCRFISGRNTDLIASAVDITHDELEVLKREYPAKESLALQMIKKWQKLYPNDSEEDLERFFMSVGEEHAAKSLTDPSYSTNCYIL